MEFLFFATLSVDVVGKISRVSLSLGTVIFVIYDFESIIIWTETYFSLEEKFQLFFHGKSEGELSTFKQEP